MQSPKLFACVCVTSTGVNGLQVLFHCNERGEKENSPSNHLLLPFSSSYEQQCGQNNYSVYCGEVNIPEP